MTVREPSNDVLKLAAQCVDDVRDSLGFELDFTIDTLPVLDHYCRNARFSNLWPDGAEILAQTVGAYFGEVIRRRFDGACHWHTSSQGSYAWRLEFVPCLLCFNPIGNALELLLEGHAQGWNADFVTHPEVIEDLQAKLERLPGVGEDDFYTLSVRYEVIETVFIFLEEWERARRDAGAKRSTYDSRDYEARIAEIEAEMTIGFE